MKKCLVLAAVAVILATTGAYAQTAAPRVPATVALSLLISLTESYLQSAAQGLQLAAATREVQSTDWRRMEPLLQGLQQSLPPGIVWFALPDGSYWTTEKGATGLSLADRGYFPRLLAGQNVMGELFVGKSSGRSSVLAAVPVRRNGRVVGALGASVYLDGLSDRLKAAMQMPPDMVFFAVDATGKITTLNFRTERIFRDPAVMDQPELDAAIGAMVRSPQGVTSFDFPGGRRTVAYGTSALLGWHFALGTITQ